MSAIKLLIPDSHVVDILGSTKGRDQPIMLMEKAIEFVSRLDETTFLDPNTVFLDPFCKAGEILLAAAMRSCMIRNQRKSPIASASEIFSELYSGRYYALSPDDRHFHLSKRTFYGNSNSHDTHIAKHIKSGKYLSESDGRLDKDIYEKELKDMINHIVRTKDNPKIIAIGNPPYQENYKGDGNNTGANPIYHLFLNALIESKMIEQFLMVIPSRWFSGGRGKSLKDFADSIKKSQQVKQIYDFENSKEVFPTVDIKGGVCFLHWSSLHKGETLFHNHKDQDSELLDLSKTTVIVRDRTSREIMKKINAKSKEFVSEIAWSWNPFGLASNYFAKNAECKTGDTVECFTMRKIVKKIKRSKVPKNQDKIATFKVACPKAVSTGGIPYRTEQLFILNTEQICTESYMVIEGFKSHAEAKRFLTFLQTDFARFLLSIKKITQDITKETWSLVPKVSNEKTWTDEKLFEHFSLSKKEIEFIKKKAKEW